MSRYPIAREVADGRYSWGVVVEVANVLARFGFPHIMSFYDGANDDGNRLEAALRDFIYGAPSAPAPEMPLNEWLAISEAALAAQLSPTPMRPEGAPVELRIISKPAAATHAAEILGHVFTLTYVSDPYPTRDGLVRIYLTGHRAAPYKGGIK